MSAIHEITEDGTPEGSTPIQRPTVSLIEKLRGAASAGFDEWRVQDPKDGSYCIAYSWPDSTAPEQEARDWLATQNTKYPRGRYADYVVACVRVVPQKDQLLVEAADEIQRLTAKCEELSKVVARKAELLRGCYAADNRQKQRIAELESALSSLYESSKLVSVGQYDQESHDIAVSKAAAALKENKTC